MIDESNEGQLKILFTKERLGVLATEIVAVAVGILIAFQVEEWRERRAADREIQASLSRLAEETRENLDICDFWGPVHESGATEAELVFRTLRAGHLDESNREQFERGLRSAATLPTFSIRTSVADEMIATGLLKRIADEELRSAIARLREMQRALDRPYPNRRQVIRDLSIELFGHVDMAITDRPPGFIDDEPAVGVIGADESPEDDPEERIGASVGPKQEMMAGTHEISSDIRYDIDDLSANRRLVNLFFDALDSRVDQRDGVRRLCSQVSMIEEMLVGPTGAL